MLAAAGRDRLNRLAISHSGFSFGKDLDFQAAFPPLFNGRTGMRTLLGPYVRSGRALPF